MSSAHTTTNTAYLYIGSKLFVVVVTSETTGTGHEATVAGAGGTHPDNHAAKTVTPATHPSSHGSK